MVENKKINDKSSIKKIQEDTNNKISQISDLVNSNIDQIMKLSNIKSLQLESESVYDDNNYYTQFRLSSINEYSFIRKSFMFYQEELNLTDVSKVIIKIPSKDQAELLVQSAYDDELSESLNSNLKSLFEENSFFENDELIKETMHFAGLCFLFDLHPKQLVDFISFIDQLPETYVQRFLYN